MFMDSYERFKSDFHKVCDKFSEKIAITFYKKNGEVEECSYAQMEQRVCEIVKTYQARGMQRGDRVAVLIPLCTNAYLDILALAYMGVTSVVLDINLHEKELMRILENAHVSCILTVETLFQEKMSSVNVPVFETSDKCLCLKSLDIKHPSDPDYEAIAILYSSGTTSKAKGVVIGYEQEINAMDYLLKVVGTTDIRYLMLFPNSHVSGFTDFLVLLLRGGQLATMEDASATQLMKGFQLYKPNTFGMVPKVWETFKCKIEDGIREKGKRQAKTIFGLISFCGVLRKLTGINLGRKLFHSINVQVFGGSLISVHFGGGKSDPEVTRFFWNLGYDCFDFYASTEANIPILVTDGKKYMDSVGRVDANPNTEIRIWNPDENGIGEIQVKSNTMMRGYFRNSELTQEAFEGDYFKTGDYGKIVKKQVYITGRIKESIHLRNGEKVSPDDIEEIYKTYLPMDLEYAVVGLPDGESYDKIGVFVVAEKGLYDKVFSKINKEVSVNYQYKKLEYVTELPKTSVGKVKRIALRNKFLKGIYIDQKAFAELKETSKTENLIMKNEANPENVLIEILEKHCNNIEISLNDRIKDDLGLDSLSVFEICIEIENVFDVSLHDKLTETTTVENLLEAILGNAVDVIDTTNSLDKYPVKRRKIDWKRLDYFSRWVRRTYDFSVEGLYNLDMEDNYIFAPNHESYFDGLFMMSTFPRRLQDRMCSMAADYLFENVLLRPGTVIMGGIPVDRMGNPTRATKRIYDLLSTGNHSMLIHPEGTRTRNGKMGEFKVGAAELSKRTGVKIVPVAIVGAWDIFPPDRNLPRIGKNKVGKKYPLLVRFGAPLNPDEYDNAEKMTQALYDAVLQLKEI